MPGIEPTSARNWDHHRPTLGTLIFHSHVDISIPFNLLAPTEWLWSLAGGSSVSVHTWVLCVWVLSHLPKFCSLLKVMDYAKKVELMGMHRKQIWCSDAFTRGYQASHAECLIKLCGLGSELSCNLRELWVGWKRAWRVGTMGSIPRSHSWALSMTYCSSKLNAQGLSFPIWAACLHLPALAFNCVVFTLSWSVPIWLERPQTGRTGNYTCLLLNTFVAHRDLNVYQLGPTFNQEILALTHSPKLWKQLIRPNV